MTASNAVEEMVVWLEGLVDAYIAMIPKSEGDATLQVSGACPSFPHFYPQRTSVRLFHQDDCKQCSGGDGGVA